jgi:hypothetical protein
MTGARLPYSTIMYKLIFLAEGMNLGYCRNQQNIFIVVLLQSSLSVPYSNDTSVEMTAFTHFEILKLTINIHILATTSSLHALTAIQFYLNI